MQIKPDILGNPRNFFKPCYYFLLAIGYTPLPPSDFEVSGGLKAGRGGSNKAADRRSLQLLSVINWILPINNKSKFSCTLSSVCKTPRITNFSCRKPYFMRIFLSSQPIFGAKWYIIKKFQIKLALSQCIEKY